jgi:hypothetical protein
MAKALRIVLESTPQRDENDDDGAVSAETA